MITEPLVLYYACLYSWYVRYTALSTRRTDRRIDLVLYSKVLLSTKH